MTAPAGLSVTDPAAYQRHRRRRTGYGMWQPYVAIEPVEAHIRALNAAGVQRTLIAALSGVSRSTLERIGRDKPSRPRLTMLRPETAERILAVRPDRSQTVDAPASKRVPALGTRRRIRALMALGWTGPQLAARLGMDRGNFARLLRRRQVTAETARKVADLYAALSDVRPSGDPSDRGRTIAAREGWPPPAAWDDDRIDDPRARPAGVLPAGGGR